jgi:hypothetical protein
MPGSLLRDLQSFLDELPGGKYAEEARTRMELIAAEARAADEPRWQEMEAWIRHSSWQGMVMFRSSEGGRPGARRLDRAPHSLGRRRHLEMSHSECRERINDRVDHRC